MPEGELGKVSGDITTESETDMQGATRTAADLFSGGAGTTGGIRFEIRRSRDGYYWRIVGEDDDRVLAASEAHASKTRCHRDLATVLLGVSRAPVADLS